MDHISKPGWPISKITFGFFRDVHPEIKFGTAAKAPCSGIRFANSLPEVFSMHRDGLRADLEEKLANYRKALELCSSDERLLYEELIRQIEEKLQSGDSDKKK